MKNSLPNIPQNLKIELKKIHKAGTSPQNLAIRASIILLAYDGIRNSQIAQKLKCTLPVIRKWIKRFILTPSINSLKDAPRSGRPPIIPGIAKCEVIKCACMPLEDISVNNWTLKLLQIEVQKNTGFLISKSEVSRILNDKYLRPHRIKMWMHSPDPDFQIKVNEIAELYLSPPAGSIVLCIDEKTGMQAIERKRSRSSVKNRCELRCDTEYKRHGTQTLIAAYEPQTGRVFAKCGKTRKAEDLETFMKEVANHYKDQDVYVIWDNLNIHHGYRWWGEFNQKHANRFHFLYTPIHASWVNQIECWFGILQRKVITNGNFKSEEDLNFKVMNFIEFWNNNQAHPFKWQFRGYWDKAA